VKRLWIVANAEVFHSSARVVSSWRMVVSLDSAALDNLSILAKKCIYLNKIPIIIVRYCLSSQVEFDCRS
jgi:hypothetical protein